ncbi:MAG: alpha/beta hydrolase [Candidatus Amulumruptor caecigallinarius]|nr:alpha/beta hydrolase [Candidatus Amulumruptor caecigallinarius]MCM1396314.1 alpha/beta hydrolase [Candidatus Amulumruptor caecigallinarius]MCM1453744.1 alpha/beta hydrolase [bacterium]
MTDKHMRLHLLIVALITTLCATAQSAYRNWVKDPLGEGFQMRYVWLADDYAGHQRCTLVRSVCADSTRRGVLYVHGFNDYFFQAEEAREFNRHGYDFYAVDLRKYGRSWLKGQKRCDARDMKEYFADIDSALMQMYRDGISRIALMGHSTGGLLCAYYMAHRANPVKIDALILNSPFLDWNLGKIEWAVPAVSAIGYLFPDLPVPQGKSTAYGESIHSSHHGEWTFDTRWKSLHSEPVSAGWVRAIDKAQNDLQHADHPIKVPILLMYSSRSHSADAWDPACKDSDVVLDVNDIKRYGVLLGTDVTCVKVVGGVHDLFLSAPAVRKALYAKVFDWLGKNTQM